MKNLYYACAISLAAIANVSAQDSASSQLLSGQGTGTSTGSSGLISIAPVMENTTIEGSAYIYENFTPAKISASEDEIFYVRYNALKDEFEVKGENNKAYALNRFRRDLVIDLVAFRKSYQIHEYAERNGDANFGYFDVLTPATQNHVLLKKESVKFLKEKFATTTYGSARPARYERASDEYYLKIGDESAVIIPTNKKKFAKLFTGNEKQVLDFIKAENIKLKNEKDLIKIVHFTNTL